ncbi:MAG: hypothetical protein IKG61_01280 [Selenomonadaceae bacterium]|nr:hypothetical protein [Selenomonadaceae bacterium]
MTDEHDQYRIPNHFERVENLLRDRRQILASFDNGARSPITYHIQSQTNLLFYKAIVAEMRNIVESYDDAFTEDEQ